MINNSAVTDQLRRLASNASGKGAHIADTPSPDAPFRFCLLLCVVLIERVGRNEPVNGGTNGVRCEQMINP